MLPIPSPGVDCGCGIASYIPIYTQRKPQNWQCAHERAYTPSQAVADWARIMGAPMGAPPLLGTSSTRVKVWPQGCAGLYAYASCQDLLREGCSGMSQIGLLACLKSCCAYSIDLRASNMART